MAVRDPTTISGPGEIHTILGERAWSGPFVIGGEASNAGFRFVSPRREAANRHSASHAEDATAS